jgi:uncharacterized Zn-binding protein involved in type VI secretion
MGQPAARITDMHVCPMSTGPVPHVGGPIITPGAFTVWIGSLPAATVTSTALCVGPPDTIIPPGATTVLLGGLPAARMGDMTTHGGSVLLGCFTVLIGPAGAGGGGTGGGFDGAGGHGGAPCPNPECMQAAQSSGSAFVGLG